MKIVQKASRIGAWRFVTFYAFILAERVGMIRGTYNKINVRINVQIS
jgi:hypothetical protein